MKSSKSGVTVLQNAAEATGNGVSLLMDGFTFICVQTSGTFSATVTLEGTVNGSDWVEIGATDLNATNHATKVKGITGTGIYLLDHTGGLTSFRARISAYTSGSVTVHAQAFMG